MKLILIAVVAFSTSAWSQSLADAARANRERQNQPVEKTQKRVFTNDDMQSVAPASSSEAPPEFDSLRFTFRQICDDPRTEKGQKLSDSDKQSIADFVKPLRARISEHERMQKKYEDDVVVLNREFEKEDAKYWPNGTPLPQATIDKSKQLRKDYDAKKAALEQKADNELKSSKSITKGLEELAKECPAAAKTTM
jgi:hypothetical protein